MTEPLLIIASVLLAFVAGMIGGFFLGWKEGKTTPLIVKQIARIRKLYNAELPKEGRC